MRELACFVARNGGKWLPKPTFRVDLSNYMTNHKQEYGGHVSDVLIHTPVDMQLAHSNHTQWCRRGATAPPTFCTCFHLKISSFSMSATKC